MSRFGLLAEFVGCLTCPSSKCVAEVGGVAEAKREGYVLRRHSRLAQVSQGDLDPELIRQLPERSVLGLELSSQRPGCRPHLLGDCSQSRTPREVGQQDGSDLADRANP